MRQCVPNFLSCVSAKYYLNWFTVGKVIIKIKRVNFLLKHSVHRQLDILFLHHLINKRSYLLTTYYTNVFITCIANFLMLNI